MIYSLEKELVPWRRACRRETEDMLEYNGLQENSPASGISTMGIEYVNRRGERYYLLQGKTKTGKPKFYTSRKPKGDPVDQMPPGYEFYEHPERGLVSVRKSRPTQITMAERTYLETQTRALTGIKHFCVDIQDDSLVVYTPATDPNEAVSTLSRLLGGFPGSVQRELDWIGSHSNYSAMLRFTLVDARQRLFTAERWCFRGSIDTWIHLSGPRSLPQHAVTYLPYLNKQSFYDLM